MSLVHNSIWKYAEYITQIHSPQLRYSIISSSPTRLSTRKGRYYFLSSLTGISFRLSTRLLPLSTQMQRSSSEIKRLYQLFREHIRSWRTTSFANQRQVLPYQDLQIFRRRSAHDLYQCLWWTQADRCRGISRSSQNHSLIVTTRRQKKVASDSTAKANTSRGGSLAPLMVTS
jgi:hypothetical protein